MLDRIKKERELAIQLLDHSCKINSGEKVLISYCDTPTSFIEILVDEISKRNAIPLLYRLDKIIKRRLLLNATKDTFA